MSKKRNTLTHVAPVYVFFQDDGGGYVHYRQSMEEGEAWCELYLDTWEHGVWFEGRLVGIAPHPDLAQAMLRAITMSPELLEVENG
jgi:hypothetical protein